MKLIVQGLGGERVRVGGTLHADGQRRPSRDQDHAMAHGGYSKLFLKRGVSSAGLSVGAKSDSTRRASPRFIARLARAIKFSLVRANTVNMEENSV